MPVGMSYMTKATAVGRIVRQTCMALIGVLLTAALSNGPFGSAASGTMIIYCGLIGLYTSTRAQALGLFKKRIILQLIAVPISFVVNVFLYAVPALRPYRWLRIFLASGLNIPLVLTVNHRRALGLSEVGLMVSTVIITMSFDSTPTFFITRLLYTTVGIAVSYLIMGKLLYVRYDLRYEELAAELRENVSTLLRAPCCSEVPKLLAQAKRAQDMVYSCLDILSSDVSSVKRLLPWKPWIPVLWWELNCNQALFRTLELLCGEPAPVTAHPVLAPVLEECFSAHQNAVKLLENPKGEFSRPTLPALPDTLYSSAASAFELELLHAVVSYYMTLQACPFP